MIHRRKPLFELTAADLMSVDLITVPEEMPLSEAAEHLSRCDVHGAPVVDDAGRCVGVLSATDIARWQAAVPPADAVCPTDRVKPAKEACQKKCGACRSAAAAVKAVPAVRDFMTADPVTVNTGAGVRAIARLLTEGHIHRVIVTDAHDKPVGVVSAGDLVAALVNSPAESAQLVGGPRFGV